MVLSAIVMAALGFVPGYVISLILKAGNLLRVGGEAEIMGLDAAELPIRPYPESGVPQAAPHPAE